jgi:hypothetical protein
MKYISQTLSQEKIDEIKTEFGGYIKVTVDIAKEELVAGGELHADGENILLENGSRQDDIWGGGINFKTKEIDSTAVLNLRPRLQNNSLEILDSKTREKFISVVKKIFTALWG